MIHGYVNAYEFKFVCFLSKHPGHFSRMQTTTIFVLYIDCAIGQYSNTAQQRGGTRIQFLAIYTFFGLSVVLERVQDALIIKEHFEL